MECKRLKMVYFSPTQTTQKVLESIAHGMDVNEVVHFDLTYPQSEEQTLEAFSDEVVIIGSPVYAGRLPVVVVERFKRLKGHHNTLAILVVVYGNREFEDALLELKNLAIDAGFIPIAGGAFIGEHSFSTEETPVAQGRPDRLDLQNAMEFGQEIKEKIKTLSRSNVQIDLEIPGNFPYKEGMPANTVAPVTHEALCGMCGECIGVCPTGAIFFEDSIKTKVELCIRCCACIRECPHEARVIEDENWKAVGARLNTNCSVRKEPKYFL